jgi:hypothetical protein
VVARKRIARAWMSCILEVKCIEKFVKKGKKQDDNYGEITTFFENI